MAELTMDTGARPSVRFSFFFWMTLVMAAIVFGGFGISYFMPIGTGTLAPLPPVVHIHGFFYFLWMILLVLQAFLINQRNVALHRSLGMLGIAVGALLMAFGTIITLLFAQKQIAASDPTAYGLMYISLTGVVGFGLLFIPAIRNIHNPAAHKRYILLATLAFVLAGLNRIYLALFDIGFETHLTYLPKYLTVDALILVMLVYDWRTMGKAHFATVVGAAVIIIPQLLHVPVVDSSFFVAMTHWLASLAQYG